MSLSRTSDKTVTDARFVPGHSSMKAIAIAFVYGQYSFAFLLHQLFVYHYLQCHGFFAELLDVHPCQHSQFLSRTLQTLPAPKAPNPAGLASLLFSRARAKELPENPTVYCDLYSPLYAGATPATPILAKRRQPNPPPQTHYITKEVNAGAHRMTLLYRAHMAQPLLRLYTFALATHCTNEHDRSVPWQRHRSLGDPGFLGSPLIQLLWQ